MIRFTLLDRDNRLLKIVIPYQEGLSDNEIEQRIQNCIQLNHQWTDIQLEEEERAELSYLGYNAKKRKQNINYQNIYQGFGTDPKTQENYNGDYLIQIGSIYDDSRDPRSLFAVASHQAAVQIKFEEAGKMKVTTRYNHQYFDGQPAKIHTDSLINELNQISEEKSRGLIILSRENNSQLSYLKDGLQQPRTLELPLIEARTDYHDPYEYKAISFSNDVYLSSTDLRCLTIALANNIEYYQQLIAGQKIGSYYIRNPNADNVQPVIVSPKALEEKSPSQWIKDHRQANERAKQGLSDAALFASIAGTKEVSLSYAGQLLNRDLLNMLTHSQGMISPVLGNTNFTTAFSDAYRPAKIDLVDPPPSIGIIGMSIDKEKKVSHYTVRLLPSQGQIKFKEKIEQLFADNLSPEQKNQVLREFTKIIQAWDRLLSGQGPENQITFERYISIRDKIINSLAEKNLINIGKLEGKTIQVYLNEGLQEAAEEIFDPKKIADARKKVLEIFGQ